MVSELDVLRAGYERTAALTASLSPGDLDRPTPCPDWDVRALLAHVIATADGLVDVLQGREADWGKDALGEDPATSVRRSVDAALEAWAAPGAVDTPSRQMPGMRVVDFALGDAVIHAWDLSAALGQPLALDDDVLQVVHARWQGEPSDTGRQYGVFGPRVDVPADAPLLHRFLGEVGRDARRPVSG